MNSFYRLSVKNKKCTEIRYENWQIKVVKERMKNMTIAEFLANYNGGNACISIKDIKEYCEEEKYDFYAIPDWIKDKKDFLEEFLTEDNQKLDIPSCLFLESWWDDIKDREVQSWNIIGGNGYPMELSIRLADS